jgi:hypothetical protein
MWALLGTGRQIFHFNMIKMLLKIIAGYTDADDDLLDEEVAKKQKRSKIGKRSTKVTSEVKTYNFNLNILMTLCQGTQFPQSYLPFLEDRNENKRTQHNYFVCLHVTTRAHTHKKKVN